MILQNSILIAAIGLPVVALVLLRTNAAIAFLSLCAGAVLVRFVGHEADLAGTVIGNNSQAVSQYAQLALLLVPVVVVALLLRKSVSSAKLVFNLIAAVAVGLVGVLLAVPLLPGAAQTAITDTEGWRLLVQSQELVVAASVLASIVVLWLTKPSSGKKHHKK